MAAQNDDDAAMRARLNKLTASLDARREAAQPAVSKSSGGSDSSAAIAKGLRIASELVAGIVVGGLVGLGLDSWLGTKPLFSIVFFLLGMAAGFWNVIRDASKPTNGPGAEN